MAHYTVSLVESEEDREEFHALPSRLYFEDPNFTPQVVPDERMMLGAGNPYFEVASRELLLCRRNGLPVGRVAVVHDPRMRAGDGAMLSSFGHLDITRDAQALRALMTEARGFCRAHGARWLEGPFNPTHYAPAGIQLDSFNDPPSTLQTYNPPWLPTMIADIGFMVTTTATFWRGVPASTRDVEAEYRAGSYTARELTPAEAIATISSIGTVLNSAFVENHRFAGISFEELTFMYSLLLPAIADGGVAVVEHEGEIVGAVLGLADVAPSIRNRRPAGKAAKPKKGRTLIVLAIAMLKQHRHSRAAYALMCAWRSMAARFDAIESSWIDDRNRASIAMARRTGLAPVKRYGLYTIAV